MRQRFLITVLFVTSFSFIGCNNQAKQQELEKQRQEDSIRVAEKVKKELAEQEAAERAEREKQEAAERAERERQEAAERAEREARTWTGASSIEELRSKLEGTCWHMNDRGLIRKFQFTNGGIKYYTALAKRGQWDEAPHYYSSYDVNIRRDTGGENFVAVTFGDENEDVEYRDFTISFARKCMIVVLFHFGRPVGALEYGDFNWSDEL